MSNVVPLDLAGGWLSVPAVRDGAAWLTEACAPWVCEAYLHVQVGEACLCLPVRDARRVIGALSRLLGSTGSVHEVG